MISFYIKGVFTSSREEGYFIKKPVGRLPEGNALTSCARCLLSMRRRKMYEVVIFKEQKI